MAALTWRNVDSPDFRGSMAGFQVAGDQFSKALTAIGSGIDGFAKEQTRGTDQIALLRSLQYSDPASYAEALKSGALTQGLNTANLSEGGIKDLGTRQGTLQDLATAQQNIAASRLGMDQTSQIMAFNRQDQEQKVLGFDRTNADNALEDAARPAAARLLLARDSGDPARIAAAAADPSLAALPADRLNTLLTRAGAVQGTALANASATDTLTQNRQDRTDTTAAQNVLAKVVRNGIDTQGAREIIEGAGLSPAAFLKANAGATGAGFAGLYGPVVAGAAGGVAGAAAGGNTPASAALSAVASGGPIAVSDRTGTSGFRMAAPQAAVGTALTEAGMSQAVVAGFMGNFHQEGGYGGAKGDGGSAAGIAQWRGPRRENFQAVMGKPVETASHAEQAKYVAWEMKNPTHPSVGMTVAQRDEILAAKTPEQAAELIDKYYERSDGKSVPTRRAAALDAYADLNAPRSRIQADAAQNEVGIRASQNQANNILPDLDAARKNTKSSSEVAQELIDSKKVSGVSHRSLTDYIDQAKAGNTENSAVNGALVARNLKANSWLGSKVGFGDFDVNMDALQVQAAQLSAGDTDKSARANKATMQIEAAVGKAKTDADAARALYDAVVLRTQGMAPGAAEATLKRYRDDLTRKEVALQAAIGVTDNPDLRAQYPGRVAKQEPATTPPGMSVASARKLARFQAAKSGEEQKLREFVESVGRNSRGPIETVGRNTRESIEGVGRVTRESIEAVGRNARGPIEAVGRTVRTLPANLTPESEEARILNELLRSRVAGSITR